MPQNLYLDEDELDIDFYDLDMTILKLMYSVKDFYRSKLWKQKKDLPNEVWASFTDYEDLYQISNYGRVRAIKDGTIKMAELHDGVNLSVHLQRNGKSNYRSIPMEVARHFVLNPYDYKFIVYKDKNVLHCHCTNLKWVKKRPITNVKKGKPIQQLTLGGKLIREYPSLREASRITGFKCRTSIKKVMTGEYKQAYGYLWKYKDHNS